MRSAQEGLICHANYWVKCPAGPAGHWSPDWLHIGLTAVLAILLFYLLLRLFGIK